MAHLNFKNYYGVAKFHSYLDCLNEKYSEKVEVFDIGRSTEGRALKVIKIGTPNPPYVKPAVWIDAGFHGREWLSAASVLYFINQVVEHSNYSQNRFILEQLDLYILPSANPDGQVQILSKIYTVTALKFLSKHVKGYAIYILKIIC